MRTKGCVFLYIVSCMTLCHEVNQNAVVLCEEISC